MNATFDSMMAAMGLKRVGCRDCSWSSPSVAYPQVRCNLSGGYVAPTFACEHFKSEKVAA